MPRPTIPEVLPVFADYYRRNPVWGAVHVVLDDGNVRDTFVDFCIEAAIERQDAEGEAIARILRSMTTTQRLKLPHRVYSYVRSSTA